MINSEGMKLKWKLKQHLTDIGVTPYVLARKMTGKVRTNETLLYRIQDGDEVKTTADTLTRILTALEELQGKPVGLSDIIVEVRE